MFQRAIDDFRDSAGRAIRLTTFATIAALTLFVTACFLCAAAFVWVLQKYGPVEACLTGAGIFFVITLIAITGYAILKKPAPARVVKTERPAAPSMLADPMLLATGLQLVRAVGVKRLIPLLAIGGLALGIMASRGNADTAEQDAPEE